MVFLSCKAAWVGFVVGVGCSCGALHRGYGVLGNLAPVHRCARSVCGVVCAASWATWLLFTGVHALVCCAVCTVSWASWLLFTGVHALHAVLCVRRPRPPGSCSPVCTLCLWCCVCGVLGRLSAVHRCACLGVLCRLHGVLGLLAPVHRCARCVCGVVGAAPLASWFLFSGVRARCAVLFVPCSGSRGSCSPACTLCVRCRVCGLLGLFAAFFWCDRVVCVVWRMWCPGTLGLCSPVCLVCVLRCAAVCVVCGVRFCVCGVLSFPASVHRCARPVCGVVCAWCPGPLGSCSPMCLCGVLCGVCGVLGHLAPVHWYACVVRCVVCTVTWASWLLFTGVRARCAVFCVWCPGPPGSCSQACL